ncbi:MAG: 50S ribosomal protein L18 [Clostridiaceae bacterium]|nr:50S ribosomal protein L18 [Clostridiales bacterium]MDD2441158.1 50S ribosomal protein L18 [Eubacteriales bacterium]MDD4138621.1 50S ribosomal protein L18 [Eubacteriales bacterium]MDD4744855.1 50S ribosomal protein L18 [Eubacteriales bacterium]NLB44321.1 50S ribosomal protein L18 [Clostridiaceae bacterium]
MSSNVSRNDIRKRKHARVRSKISGTGERPRLCVFRSLAQIYAQVIDDTTGQTLASASTLDKEIKEQGIANGNKQGAAAVGKLVAARALDKGITNVVFDRGGYIYHGRVAALAEAAREAGLKF